MAAEYSVQTCRELEKAFEAAEVARPRRVDRYDAGEELTYSVTGVAPAADAAVRLVIDKFVGGGFAGQVYRVKILEVTGEPIVGLDIGGLYAMKIMIPPSSGSVRFRNFIYWLGFQGPFSLQVNPDAARAGALWQKFIRRAARIEFGTEKAVVDILATFVDSTMGSCGELSEWLEGRNWNFEVDDNLDARKGWKVTDPVVQDHLGAPEYRAKKAFMARMVKLFHQVGAPELGRQYEWWTCKSQPNCLKRLDCDDDPEAGLTAVDFRAGLALLAWLPMSPGDVKLIITGLVKRRSLVQFDRGNLDTLQTYIDAHGDTFADMTGALDELKRREQAYRTSLIDITHNHVRLLGSGTLWGGIRNAAITGWRIRNFTDDAATEKLQRSKVRTALFATLGFIIGLASTVKAVSLLGLIATGVAALLQVFGVSGLVPGCWAVAGLTVLAGGAVVGAAARVTRSIWGRADLRRHYKQLLTSPNYFLRAARAHTIEQVIDWHRHGRLTAERAERVKGSLPHYLVNLPLSVLPAGLHRSLADPAFALERIRFIVTRPLKLYFNAELREQWMRDMVDDGLAHGMISADEADTIRGQLSEPFIQKYLKSLAVHVCTLPVTQIISVAVACIYWDTSQSWTINWGRALLILGVFQVTPISPGSLVRGFYVLGMVIKDRNYKDYKIAVWMGFWKYIGYLSFPIQMAYHYPTIARFMAGRFATGAVHILPVFGESGALPEHAVFDLFYNRPLTLRKKMAAVAALRETKPRRRWHVPICAAIAFLGVAQLPAWLAMTDGYPYVPVTSLTVVALAGLLGGLWTCWLARGAPTGSRIAMATLCGLLIGLATIAAAAIGRPEWVANLWDAIEPALMPAFLATLAGLFAAIVVELNPPKLKMIPGSAD